MQGFVVRYSYLCALSARAEEAHADARPTFYLLSVERMVVLFHHVPGKPCSRQSADPAILKPSCNDCPFCRDASRPILTTVSALSSQLVKGVLQRSIAVRGRIWLKLKHRSECISSCYLGRHGAAWGRREKSDQAVAMTPPSRVHHVSFHAHASSVAPHTTHSTHHPKSQETFGARHVYCCHSVYLYHCARPQRKQSTTEHELSTTEDSHQIGPLL